MLSKTKRAQIAKAAQKRMDNLNGNHTITNAPESGKTNLMKELFGQSKKKGATPSIMNQLAQCKGFGKSKFSRFARKINAERNKIPGFGWTQTDLLKYYLVPLGDSLEQLGLAKNFDERREKLNNEGRGICNKCLAILRDGGHPWACDNLIPTGDYLGLQYYNIFAQMTVDKKFGLVCSSCNCAVVDPQNKIKQLYESYRDHLDQYKLFINESLKEFMTTDTHAAKRILKSFADYTPFIELVKKEAKAYLDNKGTLKNSAPPEDVAKVQFAKICTALIYTKPTEDNAKEQTKIALAYYLDRHPDYADAITAIINPPKQEHSPPMPAEAKNLSTGEVAAIKPAPMPSVEPDSGTVSRFQLFMKELKDAQTKRGLR